MRSLLTSSATLLALVLVTAAQPAGAQTDAPEQARPRLPVFIASDVPIDRAVVSEAFATMPRLGLVIVDDSPASATEAVFVDTTATGVRVRYWRPDHAELTRTLVPPPGPAQAAEAVALVVINLVHDEAVDLLSLLAPPERPDAPRTDDPGPTDAPSQEASPPEQEPLVEEPPPEPATQSDPPAMESPSPEMPAPGAPGPAAHADEEEQALDVCREGVSHGGIGVDFLPMVGTSSYRPTREAVRGFSLNLIGGLSRGLHGLEIGGALNIQRSFVCGLQIAGALNVSLGPVRGLQIAPVNVATESMTGVQIGVVNVAGDARGVQLGVLNISRTAVAPIGLVSIVTQGRTEVHVTSSESGMIVVGASHGGRVVHNIYGFGARVGGQGARFVLAAGIGARLFTHNRVSMDLDAISHLLVRGGGIRQSALFQLRLPIEVRIIEQVGVFAALSYQWLYSHDAEERPQVPAALVTTHSESSDGTKRVLGWPGLSVGMRVHL